ncbi:MAG: Rieske 2Fe-2S domain-containing protein [Proteobacteria bacterium]|nr:Rieske 2Fe-2S domain-containing protein [Pseudomonadota bacterium]
MAFLEVASLQDIPDGGGLAVRVGETPVGLFRVGDRVYAMEDRCPHRDFPLTNGTLRGCVVVCAAHGWDFDVRTGFKPGDPDGFPIPCFAVRLEGDAVWVDVETVTNARRR